MKTKIHPKYYLDAKVTCACGNTFTTGSTKPEIQVEICSACHPFYTGKMKYVDSEGRVEKFISQRKKAKKKKYVKKKVRRQKKKKQDDRQQEQRQKTLKEMLTEK